MSAYPPSPSEPDNRPYLSIPLSQAPDELAEVHPGQLVTITADFRVKSVSETDVSGCLEKIAIEEIGEYEGPPPEEEKEGEGDDEEYPEGPYKKEPKVAVVIGTKKE